MSPTQVIQMALGQTALEALTAPPGTRIETTTHAGDDALLAYLHALYVQRLSMCAVIHPRRSELTVWLKDPLPPHARLMCACGAVVLPCSCQEVHAARQIECCGVCTCTNGMPVLEEEA